MNVGVYFHRGKSMVGHDLINAVFGCLLGFWITTVIFLAITVNQRRIVVDISLPSKDVIVRSVYLDNRPRSGHRNASVFMLEVRRTILDKHFIIGCSVGNLRPSKFRVRPLGQNSVSLSNQGGLTHFLAMVDCYDLAVENGSNASITYRTDENSTPITVQSEHPLIISKKSERSGIHGTPRIAVCVIVFHKPMFLNEWLLYQKTIGIDHIYMIAEDSFIKAGGFRNSYLQQLINEGFVFVEVWRQWLKHSEVRYHSQALAYQDCVYRLRGIYDYALVLDNDDFFIPRIAGNHKIQYYVKNWCRNGGSCQLKWTEFYPDCGMKNNTAIDGNITTLLTSTAHRIRSEKKSLHHLMAIIDVGVHVAHKLVKGSRVMQVPDDAAYVAHVRVHKLPPEGKC